MELLDHLDFLYSTNWNSKDALDLTMPSKDEELKTTTVYMMNGQDPTRPPEPTGIRRPGRRTDSPPSRRATSETDRLVDPSPESRPTPSSIFSEALRSARSAMHENWIRVRGGDTATTINVDTPSRSDANTVEVEQSEASYGPIRNSHVHARQENRTTFIYKTV